MTAIPVVFDDSTTDILDISARLKRGRGGIFISGNISSEVEYEIHKAIFHSAQLADFGEFKFPDLSLNDLHIDFACRFSDAPIIGQSYGLGLGVELLRLFSGRSFNASFCYTGCVDANGCVVPVEKLREKCHGAAGRGFDRIFLPTIQLDFCQREIRQVPVATIFEAWGVLGYEHTTA